MTFIDVTFVIGVDVDGLISAVVSSPATISFSVAVQFNAGGSFGVINVPVSAAGHFTIAATDLTRLNARIVVAAISMPPTPGTATIALAQGGMPVHVATPGIGLPIAVSLNNMPTVFF